MSLQIAVRVWHQPCSFHFLSHSPSLSFQSDLPLSTCINLNQSVQPPPLKTPANFSLKSILAVVVIVVQFLVNSLISLCQLLQAYLIILLNQFNQPLRVTYQPALLLTNPFNFTLYFVVFYLTFLKWLAQLLVCLLTLFNLFQKFLEFTSSGLPWVLHELISVF